MEWGTVLAMVLGIAAVLLIIGVPVGLALGLSSLALVVPALGWEEALTEMTGVLYGFWTSWLILCIPFFVLMGTMLEPAGVLPDLLDMASKWLRRLPGGLVMGTIGSCALFAAMSGSSAAASAAMGKMTIPEMLKRGYSRSLATGSVVAAGGLAQLIPPSSIAIIYSSIVETSPGKQLMAGLIPGILLTFLFMIETVIWVRLKPSAAPSEPEVSWHERWATLRKIAIPMVMVVVVLGSMLAGIATATEAAALGAFFSVVICLTRRASWRAMLGSGMEAVRISCLIMVIALGGKMLSWVLSYFMVPQAMISMVTGMELNRWAVFILIWCMYVVLGLFLDPLGMILVTVPIVYPILSSLGFDLIWFGVILVLNIEIAVVTPPMAPNLYIVKGIVPDVPLQDIIKGSMAFLVSTVTATVLIAVFPQIALWIPSMMGRI